MNSSRPCSFFGNVQESLSDNKMIGGLFRSMQESEASRIGRLSDRLAEYVLRLMVNKAVFRDRRYWNVASGMCT